MNKMKLNLTIMKEGRYERRAIPDQRRDWIQRLSEEDRAFVKRFILASGSLKELASVYGISYPTVRLRLDRLIEKIKIFEDQRFTSEFERLARARYAEERLDKETLLELLEAHRREMEVSSESSE
jgi:hypothetical protein